MDHLEAPDERPDRSGILRWTSRAWNFYLDLSERRGAGGVVYLSMWGVIILALIVLGIWGSIAMR